MSVNGQQPSDPPSGPSKEDLWRVVQVLVPLNGLSVAHAEYLLMVAKQTLTNLQRVNLTDESFQQFARDMAPPKNDQPDTESSPLH